MRSSTGTWVALVVSISGLAAACGASADPSASPGARGSGGNEAAGAPASGDEATPSATPAGPGAAKASGCTATGGAKPGDFDLSVTVGGRDRVARVHVPPGYDATRPTAVLLNFHGRMSTPSQEELLSKTTIKSNAAGFVVVYPTGVGQTWNGGLCCGQAQSENVDDVAFTRALIDELGTKVCVDDKRVFATGISNGGFMVHRLACELADRIAAIGAVAGQLLMTTCKPSRPVPVIHFHGTADNVVAYGGQFGLPGAEASMQAWAKRNGCSAKPTQTYAKGDATCVTYGGCTSDADVRLCTIQGGGHTWPGGFPVAALGKTSQDIDATDAMWEFFTAHPMP
jgi:polyhydroxybutyrate depolymerase